MVCPNGPISLVKINGGHRIEEIHIRFIKGIQCADIAPVMILADPPSIFSKLVGANVMALDNMGKDVFPEIMSGGLVTMIFLQDVEKHPKVKNVNSH